VDLLFAMFGLEYWSALWQVDQRLRTVEKYGEEDTVKVDDVRSWIREELDQRGLSLDAW
jgi:hypothetical protein